MSLLITDDCINCDVCEPECPNDAIYDGGMPKLSHQKFSDIYVIDGDLIHVKRKNISVEKLMTWSDIIKNMIKLVKIL